MVLCLSWIFSFCVQEFYLYFSWKHFAELLDNGQKMLFFRRFYFFEYYLAIVLTYLIDIHLQYYFNLVWFDAIWWLMVWNYEQNAWFITCAHLFPFEAFLDQILQFTKSLVPS